MEQIKKEGALPIVPLLKCLLAAYIGTAVLLALVSLLLYKLGLGERTVSLLLTAIYVGMTLLAGFLAGRKIQSRRFLWGLLEGAMYFAVLAVISFAVRGTEAGGGQSFLTTLVLCCAGGMLGGMLS